jgi:hypothetical protein
MRDGLPCRLVKHLGMARVVCKQRLTSRRFFLLLRIVTFTAEEAVLETCMLCQSFLAGLTPPISVSCNEYRKEKYLRAPGCQR